MSMLERAEAAERAMAEELDRTIVKSVIYVSGDRDPRVPITRPDNGKLVMMDQDPRLPRMPERPTLFDFFKYRFGPANHLMQSARLAQKSGVADKLVLACLIHDIAIAGFIRGDHGYWAAQLVEPSVGAHVAHHHDADEVPLSRARRLALSPAARRRANACRGPGVQGHGGSP